MELYLIRHAHAIDAEVDELRPLSPRGQVQILAMAGFLQRLGSFQPAEIWHSSLVRSRETAELLVHRAKLAAPLTLMPDLEPEADPRAVARRIKAFPKALAIVGHEPHLSALASLLLTGRAEPPLFVMKKCAVLALEGAALHWAVRWHVSPDLIA